MQPSPVRIYLDSSDYSVLSDPMKQAREAPGVLEELLQLRDTGQAEFFYSGAHITEMAPTEARYTDAAIRRSAVMVQLCGTNCMIHHSTLFQAEISVALGLSECVQDPIDRAGQWFPHVGEMSPVSAADHLLALRTNITELFPNANRAEKRRAQRKLTKKGALRPSAQSSIARGIAASDLREILALYPMRQDAARAFARYAAGEATADEANAAFESSLRDPRWMMQWFAQRHGEVSPFVAWARGPAADFADKMGNLSTIASSASDNPDFDDTFRGSLYGPQKWALWQDKMLLAIASRVAAEKRTGATLDVATVDAKCPGLSTGIRSLHSASRAIISSTPRNPKGSDFVDGLHAVYVPYVDIFRADGFMAVHVAAQAKRFGTVVAAKLSNLPAILRQRDALRNRVY